VTDSQPFIASILKVPFIFQKKKKKNKKEIKKKRKKRKKEKKN
jgi:hypothetical protein